MNAELPPQVVVSSGLFLACASALAVATAALLVRGARDAVTRGRAWRAALVSIALAALGDATGLFLAIGNWARQYLASRDSSQTIRMNAVDNDARAVSPPSPAPDELALEEVPNDALGGDCPRLPELEESPLAADAEYVDLLAAMLMEVESDGAATAEHDIDVREASLAARARGSSPRETALAAYGNTSWHLWSTGAWSAVAALGASWLVLARGAWLWRCRRAMPVRDVRLAARVSHMARSLGLRRRVRLLQSDRWLTPLAWGVWRPTIGLPVDFQSVFDREQQAAMLAHELGHLAARDPLWQWLADGVAVMLWWTPWCWLLRRRLRQTAEWRADEASLVVTGGPRALAECLVVLGQRIVGQAGASYGVTGGFRSNLGQRVERLLELDAAASGVRVASALRRGRWWAPALVACVVLCMAMGTAWARTEGVLTQGEQNMRWFEQAWRKSLAGGLVSLALGAPATALAEEPAVEAEVEVAVEVVEEEVEEAADEANGAVEEAEVEIEEAIEEGEEALEEAAAEAESAVEEGAEAIEEAVEAAEEAVAEALEGVEAELEVELAFSDDEGDDDEGNESEARGDDEDDDGEGDDEAEARDDDDEEGDDEGDDAEARGDDDEDDDDEGDDDARGDDDEDDDEDDGDDEGDDDEVRDEGRKQAELDAQRAVKDQLLQTLLSERQALEQSTHEHEDILRQTMERMEQELRARRDAMEQEKHALREELEKARDEAERAIREAEENNADDIPKIREKIKEEMKRRQDGVKQRLEEQAQDMKHLRDEFGKRHEQVQMELKVRRAEHDARLKELMKGLKDRGPAAGEQEKLRALSQVKRQEARAIRDAQAAEKMKQLARAAELLRESGHEDAAEQMQRMIEQLQGPGGQGFQQAVAQQRQAKLLEAQARQLLDSRQRSGDEVSQLREEVGALRAEMKDLRAMLEKLLTQRDEERPGR